MVCQQRAAITVAVAIFTAITSAGALATSRHPTFHEVQLPPQDANIPQPEIGTVLLSRTEFKYLWLSSDGILHNEAAAGRLEIAATLSTADYAHWVGAFIVAQVTRYMAPSVFLQLASQASVGFMTSVDKTTVFPEYEHLKDRPECNATCAGACWNTCTADGRKYDAVQGLGGRRATCIDANFLCTGADPFYHQYDVLVHEMGHIVHQFGLPEVSDYRNRIRSAYVRALDNETWNVGSYAMSNELEYFAEATGVFFNSNRHPTSSGGMNSCGHADGFCTSESEARNWLRTMDPMLFDALSFAFTNGRPSLLTGLDVCAARELGFVRGSRQTATARVFMGGESNHFECPMCP